MNLIPFIKFTVVCSHYPIFQACWEHAQTALKNEGEFLRFFEVEVEIANIYYYREFKGLRISNEILSRTLDSLDQDIAKFSMNLRYSWGIIDPNDKELYYKFTSEEFYKSYTELDILPIEDNIYTNKEDAFAIFYNYRKAKRDKDTLLRISPSGDRFYPNYSILGTITGRTIVHNPPIQTLSKPTRKILIPDEGMCFIYPDFSAFEPGILSNFSGDQLLLSIYNSGDIYSVFSECIF